ncbi:membrane protein, predicted to be involved in aromatic hydrocarbon degradation [Desulfosarcina variabilis str. Montpellier]
MIAAWRAHRWILCTLLVGFFYLPWPIGLVWGQELRRIEIPSSFNPVGSGARALGMGGAFIGLADDGTAASWNPAGLSKLNKRRASFALSAFDRSEDNTFGTNPEADGKQSVSQGNINYASLVYPLKQIEPHMVVAVTYQYLYDLNRQWQVPFRIISETVNAHQTFDFEQSGGLSALGLTYSVIPVRRWRFGIGFTVNIWDAGFNPSQWEETTRQTWSGTLNGNRFNMVTEIYNKYTFSGYNVNLGVLWKPIKDRLQIGAVFKSPFKADISHEKRTSSDLQYPDEPEADVTNSTRVVTDETLEMPMSYGLGLSYRLRPNFIVNLDFYRTEWSDFVLEDAQGNRTSPISGKPIDESAVDATHQIRLGGQYLFLRPGSSINDYEFPLRAGVFYDPAPAEGSPDDFYGFSLGSGMKIYRKDPKSDPANPTRKDFLAIDIVYQFRFGRNVSSAVFENLNFSQDVDEHTFIASAILFF